MSKALHELDFRKAPTKMMESNDTPSVGSLFVAKADGNVFSAGELGVCYEQNKIQGEPCYSVIFERGGHALFKEGEIALSLQATEIIDVQVSEYHFKNIELLRRDYQEGVFNSAFNTSLHDLFVE